MINADKPLQWKEDIARSVDEWNAWFLKFAPDTYRETRAQTVEEVEEALMKTGDLRNLDAMTLLSFPGVVRVLRMATAPPIARDRLTGLSYTPRALVKTLEDKKVPTRMAPNALRDHLERISATVTELLDLDILPWVGESRNASAEERARAATIIADRLCGALSDPIVRNAQELRQLEVVEKFLVSRGYKKKSHPPSAPLTDMEPGTYAIRMVVGGTRDKNVNIPIDIVIQPKKRRPSKIPLLVEAKSAGDYTNPNKRRKEEATKIRQLKDAHGEDTQLLLLLCGYFDSGYLGYEAAEGLDWVWEHRIEDLTKAGI